MSCSAAKDTLGQLEQLKLWKASCTISTQLTYLLTCIVELYFDSVSHVALHNAGKGGPGQLEQLKLWKAFLEYERSNPQRLEPAALNKRVELAYMQALMCLLHFPEVSKPYYSLFLLVLICAHHGAH